MTHTVTSAKLVDLVHGTLDDRPFEQFEQFAIRSTKRVELTLVAEVQAELESFGPATGWHTTTDRVTLVEAPCIWAATGPSPPLWAEMVSGEDPTRSIHLRHHAANGHWTVYEFQRYEDAGALGATRPLLVYEPREDDGRGARQLKANYEVEWVADNQPFPAWSPKRARFAGFLDKESS